MTQMIFLFILGLPVVLNYPVKEAFKRSPMDIRTSFDELPRLFLPPNHDKKIPLALTPVFAPHQTILLHHGIKDHLFAPKKSKGPHIDHYVPHQVLIPTKFSPIAHVYPAMSNVLKTSVHTDVKHILTEGNVIPVITKTISHSSSNITHPSNLLVSHQAVIVPVPRPLVLIHDTSVIPLHHQNIIKDPGDHGNHLENLMIPMENRQRSEPITADSNDDLETIRNPVGGFGTGLRFGGQGAGHGFFAFG